MFAVFNLLPAVPAIHHKRAEPQQRYTGQMYGSQQLQLGAGKESADFRSKRALIASHS